MSSSPSLFKSIYSLKNYPQKYQLLGLIVLPLIELFLNKSRTQIYLNRTYLIKNNLTDEYLLSKYKILGLSVLEILVKLIFRKWFFKKIIDNLKEYLKKYYFHDLLLKVNPFWLSLDRNRDDLYDSFEKGTNTIVEFILYIVSLVKKIFNIIISILIIYPKMGSSNIIPTLLCFLLSYWSFKSKRSFKKVLNEEKKFDKQYKTENNYLQRGLFTRILNGQGSQTINTILRNENLMREKKEDSQYKKELFGSGISFCESLVVFISLWFMSDLYDIAELITFETLNKKVNGIMFEPIRSYESLQSLLLDWIDMHKILNNMVLEEDTRQLQIMEEFKMSMLVPNLAIPDAQEYRITGASGSGKTTWMTNAIMKLKRSYFPEWYYLEQAGFLPRNDHVSIYKYFQLGLTNQERDIRQEIVTYAEMLGLTSIINDDTLDSPFQKPSGGETKRILALKKFLPILVGDTKPKVVFADEIMTNLDDQNFLRVRRLIELIKKEYNIIFVIVEHRDYQSETRVVNLSVRKEEEPEPEYQFERPQPEPLHFLENWLLSSVKVDNNPDEEKVPTFPPKVSIQGIETIETSGYVLVVPDN